MAAKLKICGLMQPEHAEAAVSAGAAYLGVVFAGGPRIVTPDIAGEIVGRAGDAIVMGVFTDHPAEKILQICGRTGLRGAQLHGSYSPATAARLREAGLEVWRVVRIAVPADLDLLSDAILESDAVLV